MSAWDSFLLAKWRWHSAACSAVASGSFSRFHRPLSLAQRPASLALVQGDSLHSQVWGWRTRHPPSAHRSWASAFQEKGLVATALWVSASAVTNSYLKCYRLNPQPPSHMNALSIITQIGTQCARLQRFTVILKLSAEY